MNWSLNRLPLEFTRGPFTPKFWTPTDGPPIAFYPGWVIFDPNGVALVNVGSAVDAHYICDVMTKLDKVRHGDTR